MLTYSNVYRLLLFHSWLDLWRRGLCTDCHFVCLPPTEFETMTILSVVVSKDMMVTLHKLSMVFGLLVV